MPVELTQTGKKKRGSAVFAKTLLNKNPSRSLLKNKTNAQAWAFSVDQPTAKTPAAAATGARASLLWSTSHGDSSGPRHLRRKVTFCLLCRHGGFFFPKTGRGRTRRVFFTRNDDARAPMATPKKPPKAGPGSAPLMEKLSYVFSTPTERARRDLEEKRRQIRASVAELQARRDEISAQLETIYEDQQQLRTQLQQTVARFGSLNHPAARRVGTILLQVNEQVDNFSALLDFTDSTIRKSRADEAYQTHAYGVMSIVKQLSIARRDVTTIAAKSDGPIDETRDIIAEAEDDYADNHMLTADAIADLNGPDGIARLSMDRLERQMMSNNSAAAGDTEDDALTQFIRNAVATPPGPPLVEPVSVAPPPHQQASTRASPAAPSSEDISLFLPLPPATAPAARAARQPAPRAARPLEFDRDAY